MTSRLDLEAIDAAVRDRASFANACFAALRSMSADARGVTRPSYQEGEQRAHDHVAALADDLGLAVSTDAAGNLYMRWLGRDPEAPQWMTGSHLDSVHQGGNYDGAAGVVAGLTAVAALKQAGFTPERSLTIVGFRAEECSTWFVGKHGGHLGSRSALGLLDPSELDTAIHISTDLPLGEMIARAGFDPDRLRAGGPLAPIQSIAGFTELHIEQGPVLEQRGIPVGVVTGIRGCHRARNARVLGAYSHSGAVPREYRSDAVFALSDLVMSLDAEWTRREAARDDLVVTVGKSYTDQKLHSIVKVPGEAGFTLDIRSQDARVLDEVEAFARAEAARISKDRRVRIDLDPIDRVTPARMDLSHRAEMRDIANRLNIPAVEMASGGGHDAADFHDVGIPTSMIFVRNANGSHNPDEHMELSDFIEATRILTGFLAAHCS